jgi:hypothetical protein
LPLAEPDTVADESQTVSPTFPEMSKPPAVIVFVLVAVVTDPDVDVVVVSVVAAV